jgi:hypothetical protein
MNHQSLLALIADLYAQLEAAAGRIRELERALEARKPAPGDPSEG